MKLDKNQFFKNVKPTVVATKNVILYYCGQTIHKNIFDNLIELCVEKLTVSESHIKIYYSKYFQE